MLALMRSFETRLWELDVQVWAHRVTYMLFIHANVCQYMS